MYKKKAEVESEAVSAANTLVSMTNPTADASTTTAGIDIVNASVDETDDNSIDLDDIDAADSADDTVMTDTVAVDEDANVDDIEVTSDGNAATAADTDTADTSWREAKSVWLHTITGDRGGGAAVDKLHKGLIENWVMAETSNRHGCDMHGLFKALEIAGTETFGKQGIGHKSVFQMVYLFPAAVKKAKEKYGRKGVDALWAMSIDRLMNDEQWQKKATKEMKQPLNELMAKIDKFEDCTEDDIDNLIDMISKAPANIQDPIFSRWGTVLQTCEIFLENANDSSRQKRLTHISEKFRVLCCLS